MAKGLSLRAFARLMGVAVSTVQLARDSRRITLNRDGTVDPARARREWAENTLHTKRAPRKVKTAGRRGAPQGEGNGGDQDLGSMSAAWHRARAARETIQARLLDLELQEKQGKLLDAGEVRRAVFATNRRTRDRLQGLPGRLGPEVSGLSPEDATRLLQEEVDRICDEFAGEEPSENGHGHEPGD